MGCSGSTQTKQQSPKHGMNNAPQQKAVEEPPVVAQKQAQDGVNSATLPPTDNKHIENQTTGKMDCLSHRLCFIMELCSL